MNRMAMIALVSAASSVAAAAVLGSSQPVPPGVPDLPVFPPRPSPPLQTRARVEFPAEMPMDLVRIIAPNQRETSGAEPPIARADVRIVGPNARVRDYVTPMPIVLDGWREAGVGAPPIVPRRPGDR